MSLTPRQDTVGLQKTQDKAPAFQATIRSRAAHRIQKFQAPSCQQSERELSLVRHQHLSLKPHPLRLDNSGREGEGVQSRTEARRN